MVILTNTILEKCGCLKLEDSEMKGSALLYWNNMVDEKFLQKGVSRLTVNPFFIVRPYRHGKILLFLPSSPLFKIHGESRQGAKNAWASG